MNTPANTTQIETVAALRAFATQYGLSSDWHEPDEQGINAVVIGTHLDNAFGSTAEKRWSGGHEYGEYNVVLTHKGDDADEDAEATPVAVVNLSTLLSWAAAN